MHSPVGTFAVTSCCTASVAEANAPVCKLEPLAFVQVPQGGRRCWLHHSLDVCIGQRDPFQPHPPKELSPSLQPLWIGSEAVAAWFPASGQGLSGAKLIPDWHKCQTVMLRLKPHHATSAH